MLHSVHNLFDMMKTILDMNEYDTELQLALQEIYPNYLKVLEKRQKDLLRRDHAIVVTGESSAGKSTLINYILNDQIFRGRTGESTAVICKIRNSTKSNEGQIKIYDKQDAELRKKTFCSLTNKDDRKEFKSMIKTYTEKGKLKETDLQLITTVDICMPLPILKDNTILVDTPGIGGSQLLVNKLMDYIPNAVSFIFVINGSNAGGMQKDRLPVILQKIDQQRSEMDMPCFDPKDAIFVVNKWDNVESQIPAKCDLDESDSDGDDVKSIWSKIQSDIAENWPFVNLENNVFRTSLSPRNSFAENRKQSEFVRLEKKLLQVVDENQTSRMMVHLRFLAVFLHDAKRGVLAGLQCIQRSDLQHTTMIKEQEQKIDHIAKLNRKALASLTLAIDKQFKDINDELQKFINSEDGKTTILNPKGKQGIEKVGVLMMEVEVRERFKDYILKWTNGTSVKIGMEKLTNEIKLASGEIQSQISMIDQEITGYGHKPREPQQTDDGVNVTAIVASVVATSPLWIPLVAAVGSLVAVAGLIFSPLIISKVRKYTSIENKRNIINEEYENCKKTYDSSATKRCLEKLYVERLKALVKKIFEKNFGKQISSIKFTIDYLTQHREEMKKRCDQYMRLKKKILDMNQELQKVMTANT